MTSGDLLVEIQQEVTPFSISTGLGTDPLVQGSSQHQDRPQLWFVQVNCWGLENSAIAPAYILERLVETVDRYVDCQHLRGVPVAYRRMMKAETSGRLSRLLEAFDSQDPIGAIATLTPVLRCLNVRIVILVEDADRSSRDFDPQHIQRLLWTFKAIDRLTFIVAANPQIPFEIAKLCDHLELVPRFDTLAVKRLISHLRDTNRARFPFIDPAPDHEDVLTLRAVGSDTLERIMTASHGGGVAGAIAFLLDTPRTVRQVERRLTTAWEALHGEIHLDDLLILCVLREGTPDVFDFILQHMDSARQESKTDLDRAPKAVNTAWQAFVSEPPRGEQVQTLVDVLHFPQLSKGGRVRAHPQGATNIEPSDYLRRALSERVDPSELRDQRVLTDIVNYRDHHSDEMMKQLASTWDHSPYVQVWEHFADLIPTRQLLPIGAEIIGARLTAIHAAKQDEPLLAVWRLANRRLTRNDVENSQWLSEQIARTLPFSISYANDLYYFWASRQYGVVSETGRETVREVMYNTAKARLVTAAALRAATSPHDVWDLRKLIQPADQQEPLSVLTSPSDWSWIASAVVAALREEASLAEHIAALITNTSDYFDRGDGAPTRRVKYVVDEARTIAIFGELTRDMYAALRDSWSRSPMVTEAISQLEALLDRDTGSSEASS